MRDKMSLRRFMVMLGIAGMLLGPLEYLFNYLFCAEVNPQGWSDSISASYYTPVPFLVGMAFLVGAFLIFYKGYDALEDVLFTIAGGAFIGLALFPCAVPEAAVRNFVMLPMSVTNIVHIVCAVLFFGILAYVITFRFTKGTAIKNRPEKRMRNILYRICGAGMIVSLVLGFSGALRVSNGVWISEVIALVFFGIAWITKANVIIFRDRERKQA